MKDVVISWGDGRLKYLALKYLNLIQFMKMTIQNKNLIT